MISEPEKLTYCGSNIGHDNDKEINGYWYSLVTRDNKRCLYFLCNNCYLDYLLDLKFQNLMVFMEK
jgi:hypothetical protein